MSTEWVLHSSGCDYITLTAKPGRHMSRLGEIAKAHRHLMERDGFHVKPIKALGYTGEKYGNWFYGVRDDGAMLRVSGDDANTVVDALEDLVVNCSRIDVQITVKSVPSNALWAVWAASEAESRRKSEVGCNWASLSLLNRFGRGDTLTVGSRTSEKYGRLYDKDRESLDPSYGGCWRYEVEYKGEHAKSALQRLRTSPSLAQAAGMLAMQQWRAWCVPIPDVGLAETAPLFIEKTKTDVERKKDWLMSQVLPSLAWLVDNGYESVVDILFKHAYNTGGER